MKILIGFKNGNGLESDAPDGLDGAKLYELIQKSTTENFIIFQNSIVSIKDVSFIHIVPEPPKEKAEVVPFDEIPGKV